MPSYNITVTNGPWTHQVEEICARIGNIENLLDKIADEDVLPALARNYDSSGLKQGTGKLKQAISKRGAVGNQIYKHGATLTVGIDYAQVPGSRWAIEGRGPVHVRNAKALHFKDESGRDVFVKHVGPAPAHDVYYLTSDDLRKIEAHLEQMIVEGSP